MAGLVDGMGGEEVNQSVTITAIISGTNVYAATAVTAAQGVFAGSVTSSVGALSAAGTGSPTTWGMVVQAGSGATAGGSNAWVVFGTAFGSAPIGWAVSAETNEAILVPLGSLNAGSIYVETITASQDFTWLAIGPE